MKLLEIIQVVAAASIAYAGRKGCDIPLSEADPDLTFTAHSYAEDREPERAKYKNTKAWCAKKNTKYKEYLQVNLSSLRHISAVKIQGYKGSFSDFYVKSYLLAYSIDGKKFKFYKSKTKSPRAWTIFTGNTDAIGKSVNEIHPSFVAQYVRIYPLSFHNEICMKAELYGCNETVDCTHVIKLNQDQKVTLSTPSYPLPFHNHAHCNWLVKLPKPAIPVSIIALDFDVGGPTSDDEICNNTVVKIYKNHHPFSKYLIRDSCNKSVMPRETTLKTDSLRISFTGGVNLAKYRGFSLLVWASQTDYKKTKACENSVITLDCLDADQDIEVIAAYYGRRSNSPVCTVDNSTTDDTSIYTDSCKAPDVLPKLQTLCDYRNVCKIVLDKQTFPHDCSSGALLEMFVVYQCNLTKPVTTQPTTVATTLATAVPADTSSYPHGATTKIIPQHQEDNSVIVIAAVAGGVVFILLIIIVIITFICCQRKNKKAEVAKKGVVPSESTQSKVMIESDSLYEKIDELDMDPVRYTEAEPNKYSPLHGARRGMSENPLYQTSGPTKANSSYDVPNTARYENYTHHSRPHSAGNILATTAPESSYIDVLKSPEELPSNSPPLIKYLEPSRSPQDFSVTIPLDRYSDSVGTPTGSPGPGDDVYEAMDGSNA